MQGVLDPKTEQYGQAEVKPLMVEDPGGNITGGIRPTSMRVLLAKGVTVKQAQEVCARAARVCGWPRRSESAGFRLLPSNRPLPRSATLRAWPYRRATITCGPSSTSAAGCGATGGRVRTPWFTWPATTSSSTGGMIAGRWTMTNCPA